MKSFLKTLLLASSATAADLYDYKTNGADWGDLTAVPDNKCGAAGKNQSPIDLKTKGWTMKHSNFDNFNKIYTDQTIDATVKWNGHTSQVALTATQLEGNQNLISSKHGADQHGGHTTYEAVQFHFHAGSEHTVDGVRQDIEMHTVHLATATKSGFIAAAMGIMFSVNDYTPGVSEADVAIIDNFFESLEWTNTASNPTVSKIPYGQLMMMFNMRDRWTYKGSVTTPPCAENVYWNVLRTIYPVKQKYVDQFKNQLARKAGLEKTGNWRVTLPLGDDHDPVNLYSNLDLWDTGSLKAPTPVTPAKPAATTPAAGGAATAAPAAGGATAAAPAAAGGQVSLQQQGTIIVQHQGYLQAGAPPMQYPQPQQYYAPPPPVYYPAP
jgi:carbonic anhydrase